MSSVALDIIAETKRRSLNRDVKPDSPIRGKIGKCTIHHESEFKALWDWFVLALVLYISIEIPYEAAFFQKEARSKGVWEKISTGEPREVVNLLVDLMFIADILINFRTTYVDTASAVVISAPKRIAVHYLKTWFTIDFVSAIPFDYFIPDEFEGVWKLINKALHFNWETGSSRESLSINLAVFLFLLCEKVLPHSNKN